MSHNAADIEEFDPTDEPSDDDSVALTHRQITALPYLVASPTVTEGARLAGMSRRTVHRWMEDDHFRVQFERLRDEALSLAQAELKGLTLKGAGVLAEMLEDPSSNIRLRAAQIAISAGTKVNEQSNIQERIEHLSEAFHLQRSRKPLL